MYIFAIISKMEHFGEKYMRETMIPLVRAIQILINDENIRITLYKVCYTGKFKKQFKVFSRFSRFFVFGLNRIVL